MPLLFNPENDLALGLGCRHYTPSPRVSALHRAGELMPAWWAGAGDEILAPHAREEEIEWLRREYGLTVKTGIVGRPAPWGWSEDAARQFAVAGVGRELLPSHEQLERMRQLSHRRSSVAILRELGCGHLAGREVCSADDIPVEPLFIKSPWSCSGRGVFSTRGRSVASVRDAVAGIIRRQGSVMVEREFDRVRDFAALFRSDGRRVRFAGWSVFRTGASGAYSGNVVAPQGVLKAEIGCEVDIRPLEEVLTRLVAPHYAGPLGVDMMVYRDGHEERVHPCVEMNLRMTMGFVAMEMQERLLLDSPRLLGWEYGSVSGTPVLMPVGGFALTLRAF